MARDVHGLRQDGNQVTEGQAASEARQVEVGSAFRVIELDHKAVDTRNIEESGYRCYQSLPC